MRAEQRVIADWLERTRANRALNWKAWAERVQEKFGVKISATTISRAVKDDYESVMSVPTLHMLAVAADEPSVLDFLAGNAAGADTQPPAWDISLDELVAVLKAVREPLSAGPSTEADIQALARTIYEILIYRRDHPEDADTPDKLLGAGRVIASRPTSLRASEEPGTPNHT